MKSSIKNLSVFFPCVNEEENIKNTIDSAVTVLNNLKIQYEIIIVEDGSTDNTGKIADNLAKFNPKIRVIHHGKNLGYGSALKTGFKNAKYEWVAFADSDGQFDFNEIKLFVEKADKSDLVLGYRLKRADSFLRKLYTFGWQMIAKILLGLHVRDYSCGFKMIKKSVFNAVLPLEGEEKVTQIEFLVKAKRLGFKFIEVGVHHYPRIYGKPTGAKIAVVIRSVVDLFKLWWKINDHKLYFFILVTILILAAFLRFYRLPEYMTFLGDEGRDALVIKKVLVDGDVPFIGPPTSIGNMYLGPLYYYMMVIPMAIFWLNPIAAAGMVALIGIITVWLIYYLAKEWFGYIPGLVAAFLYAISPVSIIYSRSSWNPNPAPFFSLLAVASFYKAHKSRNFKWLVLTGISLSFVVQMHYLALILIPIYGVLWLYELWLSRKAAIETNAFISGTIMGIIAFFLLLLPLFLFDIKHNYMNYRAVTTFFTQRETTVNLNPLNTVARIIPIYSDSLVARYIAAQNLIFGYMLSLIIISTLIIGYFKKRGNELKRWPYFALGVWLVIGLLGLSLYKQTVYDHYIGFLSPVPFLLTGASLTLLSRKNYRVLCALLLVIVLGFLNFQKSPILSSPNRQLERTQEVAKFIIQESNNKPFNFALIAKSNYDAAYQFYLDIYGFKPKQVPFEITDQLFVVCEDEVCQPQYNPKYEIAGFGWSKIEKEYSVSDLKVYKMVHNNEGN